LVDAATFELTEILDSDRHDARTSTLPAG
jgi:hypothetical protein